MKKIIFLAPIFKETLWGGDQLKKQFNYAIPSECIGECWAISAHENGDCKIINAEYKGMTLSDLWAQNRALFGNLKGDRFPLLTKIIDAKQDLSVQVHPDDQYAYRNENGELGKTECWYIIDCDDASDLILGHNAKSKEEMQQMIKEEKWSHLLRKINIKPGDFFFIPPGTIHAIRKGTMILETQQSSDITYRVYDYNRVQNGKARDLHIEKSLDVTKFPFMESNRKRIVETLDNGIKERLIKCEYFSVYKIKIMGKQMLNQDQPFLNVSVLHGEGTIDGIKIKKGDHFIIPANYGSFLLEGDLELIYSHV